jgi:ATP synthase protein I
MSDTEAEPVGQSVQQAAEPAAEPENPHAKSVLQLADAMLRATLVFGVATVVLAMIVCTIVFGVHGLLGALVGGVVALASSFATIAVMRFCAALDPIMVMAIVLGSYVVKILILLGLMTLLRGVDALQPYALAITMLVTFMVAAAGEMRAFKRTKIPTIIPMSK